MTIVDTMEAYDPFYSQTWTKMASMPLAPLSAKLTPVGFVQAVLLLPVANEKTT